MTRQGPLGSRGELKALEHCLTNLGSGLVAVSGGVDSRFLALVCARLSDSFQAVFFSGPHQSQAERLLALSRLEGSGLVYHVLSFDPLENPVVAENSKRRCYHCKREIFSRASDLARDLGLPWVMDGSHRDDLASNRPGLLALKELEVVSPLAEAGLGKKEIGQLAESLGLERPDQSPRPCLLTRFAYALTPDRDVMSRVAQAEDALADLGFMDFRVRVLPGGQFVLQLTKKEKYLWPASSEGVHSCLKELGMGSFEVRWDDQVSGFFDRLREGA